MKLFKAFLKNLVLLIALVVVMYILAPRLMNQATWLAGAYYGPLLITILVVGSLLLAKRS